MELFALKLLKREPAPCDLFLKARKGGKSPANLWLKFILRSGRARKKRWLQCLQLYLKIQKPLPGSCWKGKLALSFFHWSRILDLVKYPGKLPAELCFATLGLKVLLRKLLQGMSDLEALVQSLRFCSFLKVTGEFLKSLGHGNGLRSWNTLFKMDSDIEPNEQQPNKEEGRS